MMNMANYIVKYKYKVYDCISVEPVFGFNGDFTEMANKKIKYLDVYYLDNGKMCVVCDLVNEFTFKHKGEVYE